MKKYNCDICKYATDFSSNFVIHKKSKKHLLLVSDKLENNYNYPKKSMSYGKDNINVIPALSLDDNKLSQDDNKNNKKFICINCKTEFTHNSNLSRHKKKCSNNITINAVNNDQEDLKVMVKELKIKMEFMERENKLLSNILENANSVINKTTSLANTNANVSMSAIKYANDKFKNTPALLPLENFKINNLDFDNQEDKAQLVEILIYNAKQKSLDKLLGDHIVKEYKKDNPEEQTFHTTDCSRLNFIVRELIENALIWSIDKNGIKICSSIIKPLINKCISALLEHQKTLLQTMGTGNYTKQKDVEQIIDVIMSIDSGSLETDINKYIAPFFNLNKNLNS